jgi:mono/diheme cytochrome c family protein
MSGATATAARSAGAGSGRDLFVGSGCGGCHRLAAAGTTGTAGQDLDKTRPSYELVIQRVTKGSGAMPSFAGLLNRRQIEVIARYVARSTG